MPRKIERFSRSSGISRCYLIPATLRRGASPRPICRRAPPAAGAWILAATILASSTAFIDGTVVSVGLSALQSDLPASVTEVQWVVETYSLFLSAFLLLGGSLGDHYRRRRLFLLGVLFVFARGHGGRFTVDRQRSGL